MSVTSMLNKEIMNRMDEIGKMATESSECRVTTEQCMQLLDRYIQMEKIEEDARMREIQYNADLTLRTQQLASEKRDRIIKNILTGVSIIGGFAMTAWMATSGWKFEESGTIMTNLPGKAALERGLKRFF